MRHLRHKVACCTPQAQRVAPPHHKHSRQGGRVGATLAFRPEKAQMRCAYCALRFVNVTTRPLLVRIAELVSN